MRCATLARGREGGREGEEEMTEESRRWQTPSKGRMEKEDGGSKWWTNGEDEVVQSLGPERLVKN